jgi:rhamnulokinase
LPFHIAVDLGAESGRVVLGRVENGRMTLEEVRRFLNPPVLTPEGMRWDLPRLLEEAKAGVRKVLDRGVQADSLSADSWGVDYQYLAGKPGLPFCYRDPIRNKGALGRLFERVPAAQLYASTGIQFMAINTFCQLLADETSRPEVLKAPGQCFLPIADWFNFSFSGRAVCETTMASTTQCLNASSRHWDWDLIEAAGLPRGIFPLLVPPGTKLGVSADFPDLAVVASCSHDTAAAVAAVPAQGDSWAFLSSGTWSLLGVELTQPVLTEKAHQHNFTNEAGFGGTVRLLKNITGLYILQECRRQWAVQGVEHSYAELASLAEEAAPLRFLIDPAAPRFSQPGGMVDKVRQFCAESGQPMPVTPGEIGRCILESLALNYRRVLAELEEVTGGRIRTIHVVGGGSQNRLLNQWTADATRCQVVAGPVEATAAGNVGVQAITLGGLAGLPALRDCVRQSFSVDGYEPGPGAAWDQAYGKFRTLSSKMRT